MNAKLIFSNIPIIWPKTHGFLKFCTPSPPQIPSFALPPPPPPPPQIPKDFGAHGPGKSQKSIISSQGGAKRSLTLKVPITTEADNSKIFFHCFSEKIRFDVSSESSARQRIHMKNQALFSSKDKSKKLNCRLLHFLFCKMQRILSLV